MTDAKHAPNGKQDATRVGTVNAEITKRLPKWCQVILEIDEDTKREKKRQNKTTAA